MYCTYENRNDVIPALSLSERQQLYRSCYGSITFNEFEHLRYYSLLQKWGVLLLDIWAIIVLVHSLNKTVLLVEFFFVLFVFIFKEGLLVDAYRTFTI